MVDMVRNVAKRIAFSMLGTPALLKRKIERSARDRESGRGCDAAAPEQHEGALLQQR